MKRFANALMALVAFCLIFPFQTTAQNAGEVDMTLVVQDNKGMPMANTKIEFVEVHSRERVLLSTNEEGEVNHLFDFGRYWQINIKDVRDYYFWQFEVRPNKRFTMQKRVTYDHKRFLRETRAPVDRSQLSLRKVPQNNPVSVRGDEANGIVHLKIKRGNKQPLGTFPVNLTCYALQKTFTSRTNTLGEVFFKVPIGQEYEIDIDGIPSFQYVDLPNRPRYKANRSFTYEPTLVKETTRRDTTIQNLVNGQKGTSGRVIAGITLRGGPDGVWKGEPVFLEVLGEKQWYKSTTDESGGVRFLLPKGKQYMIHGRFEKNLDVLDYRRRRGIGYSNKSVLYRPLDKYQFPEKYIPQPEDLIVTAFEEFLDKQYPRPEEGQALRTVAGFTGLINENSKEAVLRLAVTSHEKGNITNAPPLNLSFVIDKSGSMAGEERIGYLKESLIKFTKQLRPKDRISLVTFENFEEVVIPSQKMDHGRVNDAIEGIEAGGGTNIYKGLMEGYKQVARHYASRSINRVLLLSDGFGVTPAKEILDAQKPYTKKGISCSTVGVGEAYNYSLLKLLASEGGGHIEHVAKSVDLKNAFMNQMASVLFPIAQNVVVEITYPEGLEYNQLYGYPLKEKSGRVLKFKLKNAFIGLDQLALIRFRLNNPTPEMCEKPVHIKLKFRDVATNTLQVLESEVKLEWEDFSGKLELVRDQNEKKMLAIAVMNQSLKVMADRFHAGDTLDARNAIADALYQLKEVYPTVKDEDLLALEEELENYLDILVKQLPGG